MAAATISTPSLLAAAGHAEAFIAYGGCARVLLYDNLKSAVLERVRDAARFNPELLAFAAHHASSRARWP